MGANAITWVLKSEKERQKIKDQQKKQERFEAGEEFNSPPSPFLAERYHKSKNLSGF